MISERTGQLFTSNTRWRDKKCNEEPRIRLSLSDRLSSLATSADRWKTRVDKEPVAEECRPVGRKGKNEESRSLHPTPRGPPIDIGQGLSSFFPNNSTPMEESPENVDLDVIAPTQTLSIFRKTPVARPQKSPVNRTRIRENEKERALHDLQLVKPSIEGVNEDILVFGISEGLNDAVAKSAKDGLSSIEDYSETKKSLRSPTTNESPYPDVLLIQVGGDESIDVRAVPPSISSIHEKAAYLLITQSSLIIHYGEESKVLERSKAVEVASSITHTKQLNCSASKAIKTCENSTARREFDRELRRKKGDGSIIYGDELIKKNRVFSVDLELKIEVELVGQVPCHSLLDPAKCLIFDFHSELYIWSGRKCKRSQSIAAEDYCRQMQSQLSTFLFVRKISQGIPDVLFTSKFVNWPTDALVTSRPVIPKIERKDFGLRWKDKKESDVGSISRHLIEVEEKRDEIVIEETPLDGTNENVITEGMYFYRLEGDGLERIEATNELMRNGCYVIRWQYRVETKVGRLFGAASGEERETGRERVAYFYWLGRKSGVKERGSTALRLSEMDRAKRPHIRMEEGKESSIFLSLFHGLLTVRDPELDGEKKIYLVLSKSHQRTVFTQLDASSPLRSHGTYICESGGRRTIIAGFDSVKADIQATFPKLEPTERMSCLVEGEEGVDHRWMSKGEESNGRLGIYRILGSESDIVEPERPGTTFPYSQSCLEGTILIECGQIGWLWSEGPIGDATLHIANLVSSERGYSVRVVEKGREPNELKALFPIWEEEEEKRERLFRRLEEVMAERSNLTLEEAMKRKEELSEQLDIESLEKNLCDSAFLELYEMGRDEFSSLPQWKQLRLRKEKGFF